MSGLFTALAILTRFVGVTLLAAGLIAIVVKNKSRLRKAVSQTLLFGLVSCLPVIPWLYRNMTATSRLTAGFSPNEIGPFEALLAQSRWMVVAVSDDFFGPLVEAYRLSGLGFCRYMVPAVIVICLILLAAYAIHRKALHRYVEKNCVAISYVFIYLITLAIAPAIWLLWPVWRFLCPVYPFIILAVVSFVFHIYRQIKKPALKPTLFFVITIFCVSFLVLQVIGSLAFYQEAKDGQGFNSSFWRNSQAVVWVENNVPDDAIVYSNNVWGITLRGFRP